MGVGIFIISKNNLDDTVSNIDLGAYINLEVHQDDIAVNEEELQYELEHRLIKYAEYKTIQDGKIEKGDVVTIELKGENYDSPNSYETRVGDYEIDLEIDKALIGMCKNGEKEIIIDDISYHMKVVKIQRIIYPELDDEFAKSKLGCESFSDYKKQVKEDIFKIKNELEINNVKEELMDKVVNNSDIYGCTEELINKKFYELKHSYE